MKQKRTSADDVQKLDVMKPWIGDVPLRDFKIQHAEKVLAKLAEQDLAGATLRGYAQVIHRVLALAVYPGKLLAHNPLPEGFLPDKGPERAKSFLYPSEEAALLARRDVPIERRMLFGVLAREGLRLSEALDLTWSDIDLGRGTLSLDDNKTDDPRAWALAPDVAEALRRWRKLRPKAANVFDRARLGSDKRKLAGALRDDLRGAGVERPALFASSDARMALRVHDLRATFVTLALASGRSEAWVTDRTGHKSSAMVAGYKRQVRTAAELNLGWLAPLDAAIPELCEAAQPETLPEVSRDCLEPMVWLYMTQPVSADSAVDSALCTRRDLNPHTLRYRNLNPEGV